MRTIDITNCARCEQDHMTLEMKELKRPVNLLGNQGILTHWAMCPVEKDPILIKIIKVAESNKDGYIA